MEPMEPDWLKFLAIWLVSWTIILLFLALAYGIRCWIGKKNNDFLRFRSGIRSYKQVKDEEMMEDAFSKIKANFSKIEDTFSRMEDIKTMEDPISGIRSLMPVAVEMMDTFSEIRKNFSKMYDIFWRMEDLRMMEDAVMRIVELSKQLQEIEKEGMRIMTMYGFSFNDNV